MAKITDMMQKIDYVENPYYNKKYMELSTARAIVINPETKQQLFMCELESDELAQTVEEEKIKADIYNHTICTINKNKEITMKIVEVVSRMDLQLLKFGATMEEGIVYAWTDPAEYKPSIQKDDKGVFIELEHLPALEGELNIYYPSTSERVPTDKYTREEKKIYFDETYATENADKLVLNTKLMVSAYQYKTKAKYAEVKEEPIPSVVKLIVIKPLFDTNDKIVAYKQYIFPSAKMNGSITLTGNTEKSKQTEETNFTIQKSDDVDYLFKILFIDKNPEDYIEEEPEDPTIDTPEISDLSATEDAGDVDLTWSLPVTGTLTALKLQYRTESGSFADVNTDGTTGVNIPTPLSTSDTSVTVTGLTPSTKYYFRLVMNGDTSLISNTANVTLA